MENRYCPQCGAQVSPDDRFCPACGAPQEEIQAANTKKRVASKSPSNPLFSPYVIGAIALAGILLIAAGLLLNRDTPTPPRPTTVAAQPPPPTVDAGPAIPFPEIGRAPLQEARDNLDNPDVVFVDVRGADDYADRHIPGALSIPLTGNELAAAYEELPRDARIITYCT